MSLVRLHVTVQQLTFPLCLVAASGLRPQVRPRLSDIPSWPLRQIPRVLAQCSVDMLSGLALWPLADNPHITQEGFILHGSNSEIRAKVYRFLPQRETRAMWLRAFVSTWHGSARMAAQFKSLTSTRSHLTASMPPPAERRAANHISPQQTRLGDLRLGVSETTVLTQGQEESSHHPFPSLIQDAMRK